MGCIRRPLEDVSTVLPRIRASSGPGQSGIALAGLGKTTEAIASLRKAVAQTRKTVFRQYRARFTVGSAKVERAKLSYTSTPLWVRTLVTMSSSWRAGGHSGSQSDGRSQIRSGSSVAGRPVTPTPLATWALHSLGPTSSLRRSLRFSWQSTLMRLQGTQDSQTYAQLGDALELANRLDEAQAAFVKRPGVG